MKPSKQGRHCAQCDHVVADLTRATDAELLVLFTSDAKPKCARFDPQQLERVLSNEPPPRAGALPLAAFTSLVTIASGGEALAQQGAPIMLGEPAIERSMKGEVRCAPTITGDTIVTTPPDTSLGEAPEVQQVMMEGIVREVVGPEPEEDLVDFCGTILDEAGEPLPFVRVTQQHGQAVATTDEHGAFTLRIPARQARDLVVLRVRAVGYEVLTVEILPEVLDRRADPVPPSDPIDAKDPLGITGLVEDVSSGRVMSGVVVRLIGTDVEMRSDEHGRFGFRLPLDFTQPEARLEFTAAHGERLFMNVPRRAVPCCVPVKLKATHMPALPAEAPATACRSVGEVRLVSGAIPHVVGMLIVQPVTARPSMWQRLTAPFR